MTVARVLREPHKVAPGTRVRVATALDETSYSPDFVARSLKSRRSGMVGAIIPVLANSFIADTIQGISDELAQYKLQLVLGASGFSAANEEAIVRGFLSRRVDALYLTGSSHSPATVELLRRAGIPVVEGANLPKTPIDLAVGTVYADASAAVVRLLVARYGTQVAYIGGAETDNDRMRDRRHGYVRALAESGVPEGPVQEVPITMAGGRQAMARLLTLSAQPRAVFCATDIIAAGAVFEARRRGVRLPEEMAVAGFDDLEIAGEIAPALTTVRVPRYEIGRQAARLIQMRLSGETPEHAVYDLGFELVQRESA
jgi:LacI family gluconate utilization system Gnt-I transcriptional repressor